MASSQTNDREVFYDLLRGFTIIGVVWVNSASMNLRLEDFDLSSAGEFAEPGNAFDVVVNHFLYLFFADKSYTAFCFLFGVTSAYLVESCLRRGQSPAAGIVKRACVLILIGLIDIAFAWHGDILIIYAVLSLVMIPLAYMDRAQTIRAMIGLTGLFILANVLMLVIPEAPLSPDLIQINFQSNDFLYLAKSKLIKFYQWYVLSVVDGDYSSITYYAKFIFVMACGFAFKRLNVLEYLRGSHAKLVVWSVFLFCAGMIAYAYEWEEFTAANNLYLVTSLFIPAAFALGLLYVTVDQRVLLALRPLLVFGRNSMSIYILNSLYFSLIYYGYGLGLHGVLKSTEIFIFASIYLCVMYGWLSYRRAKGKLGPFEIFYRYLMRPGERRLIEPRIQQPLTR